MKALTQVRNIIDKVLSAVFALIFAFMVCIGTYQIVVRYFFNSPSTVSEELLTYSFTWMALLAAAYVFGKRDHMRMSFLSDKITGKPKMILEIAIELLIMVMIGFVMIFGGFSIMQLTMTQATASLGIPMGVIYTIIPILGCIIFVYSILNIIDLLHSGSAEEGDGRKEESA